MLIRYADDFVVHCHTSRTRSRSKPSSPRGWRPEVALNEDKTQVVSLSEGYDFLGFTVRGYRQRR